MEIQYQQNNYEWSLARPETRSEGWPPGMCRAWQTTSRHPATLHSPWEASSLTLQQNWSEMVDCLVWHLVNLQCCQNQQDSQVHLDHHVNVVLSEKDNNLTKMGNILGIFIFELNINISTRLIIRNKDVGRNWVRKFPTNGFWRRNSTTSPVKFRISAVQ